MTQRDCTPEVVPVPRPGELVAINGKTYAVCNRCGSLVRIDKPIFGNLHLCNSA